MGDNNRPPTIWSVGTKLRERKKKHQKNSKPMAAQLTIEAEFMALAANSLRRNN
jgi:hypothetical protein